MKSSIRSSSPRTDASKTRGHALALAAAVSLTRSVAARDRSAHVGSSGAWRAEGLRHRPASTSCSLQQQRIEVAGSAARTRAACRLPLATSPPGAPSPRSRPGCCSSEMTSLYEGGCIAIRRPSTTGRPRRPEANPLVRQNATLEPVSAKCAVRTLPPKRQHHDAAGDANSRRGTEAGNPETQRAEARRPGSAHDARDRPEDPTAAPRCRGRTGVRHARRRRYQEER